MAMQEPTTYVLVALAEGPQHGYALLGRIADLSKGQVRLKPATLYGALDRLTEQGLVAVSGEEQVDGRLRRYFTLTPQGRTALVEQEERLRHAADAARAALRRATTTRTDVRGATA